MQVETMLPFGKADSGLKAADGVIDLLRVAEDARSIERLGFDGLAIQENKDDPFIVAALALQATTRITAATSVAIAFARSPAVTAMSAWSLARMSGGRFVLGLGSQVKGHIERRFGMPWSPPGPWMRDYLAAVRALWTAWQSERPVDFRSNHYQLTLNVPVFTPAPLTHGSIALELAAVNPYMCQVAGEVADGLRVHPICTAHYIETVILPAVRRGAEKAQRELNNFTIGIKPLVATAPTAQELLVKIAEIRGRIAFYGSTPAYRAPLEAHGLTDLAQQLNQYSRAQRWSEMADLISDDVLQQYAVVGTYDEIIHKIKNRFGRLATLIEFSIPVRNEADEQLMTRMIQELKR
jgi:probable F420-dependent oxidoreductase